MTRDAVLNSNLMKASNLTGRFLTNVFGFQAADRDLFQSQATKKMRPQ